MVRMDVQGAEEGEKAKLLSVHYLMQNDAPFRIYSFSKVSKLFNLAL